MKMGAIRSLKAKIIESGQTAFQQKTFSKFEGLCSLAIFHEQHISDIKFRSSRDSKARGRIPRRFAQSDSRLPALFGGPCQANQAEEQRRYDYEDLFGAHTKWLDYAKQEFEKNKKNLNPLPDSAATFTSYLSDRHPGTCEWIYGNSEFESWRSSPESGILCIDGEHGE
jgi:hypothetical protein